MLLATLNKQKAKDNLFNLHFYSTYVACTYIKYKDGMVTRQKRAGQNHADKSAQTKARSSKSAQDNSAHDNSAQ